MSLGKLVLEGGVAVGTEQKTCRCGEVSGVRLGEDRLVRLGEDRLVRLGEEVFTRLVAGNVVPLP